MELEDFAPTEQQATRILNALWAEVYPDEGPRPVNWHPSRDLIQKINLPHVHGLGLKSTRIVVAWLRHKVA